MTSSAPQPLSSPILRGNNDLQCAHLWRLCLQERAVCRLLAVGSRRGGRCSRHAHCGFMRNNSACVCVYSFLILTVRVKYALCGRGQINIENIRSVWVELLWAQSNNDEGVVWGVLWRRQTLEKLVRCSLRRVLLLCLRSPGSELIGATWSVRWARFESAAAEAYKRSRCAAAGEGDCGLLTTSMWRIAIRVSRGASFYMSLSGDERRRIDAADGSLRPTKRESY